jgi:hypothetical protein
MRVRDSWPQAIERRDSDTVPGVAATVRVTTVVEAELAEAVYRPTGTGESYG